MEHFADELLSREYDLSEEILAIEKLFLMKDGCGVSIYGTVSNNFLYWHLRNNYIEFDTFFNAMGIGEIVEKSRNGFDITLDDYIYYCEYILNIFLIHDVNRRVYVKFIRDNIINLLEKLNYVSNYSEGKWHIVEKNVLVSECADIVQDDYDLGESVYSFNYRENKGNINKKADILCRLYKYIEGISAQAKQYGYSNLLEDIKDLMNKLDIRHIATSRQANVIEGMDNSEYEMWIDELFKMALSLIVLTDYTSKKKDIKELKGKLG